jgi:hypothetical protein
MMGLNLFFLVVEVTENKVKEWHFENNQTDAKARVELIKATPVCHVQQVADEKDFVDVWVPKDKKRMKPVLTALAESDVETFVALTRKPCTS